MPRLDRPDASHRKVTLPLPDTPLDERSRRAREEAMAVTAFGTSTYEVESESGNTYLVDVRAGRCTCPDHLIRSERCKHLRRVAMEITLGRVPPPGMLARQCRVCDVETFVPADDEGPYFCDAHRLRVGSLARDRETDSTCLVVAVSDRRADEVAVPEADTTVAGYPTNDPYPDDDPVVSAVYVDDVRVTADGSRPESLRLYDFPHSRLEALR